MRTKAPRVTVLQGACRLNDLWLVHSGPGFMHLRGDMRAKYAGIVAYSGTSVFIGANGRTLSKEPKREWETPHGMTEVQVHVPGGHRWTVEATLSRYTLDVFCFTARTGRFVWSTEHGNATSRHKARQSRYEKTRRDLLSPPRSTVDGA